VSPFPFILPAVSISEVFLPPSPPARYDPVPKCYTPPSLSPPQSHERHGPHQHSPLRSSQFASFCLWDSSTTLASFTPLVLLVFSTKPPFWSGCVLLFLTGVSLPQIRTGPPKICIPPASFAFLLNFFLLCTYPYSYSSYGSYPSYSPPPASRPISSRFGMNWISRPLIGKRFVFPARYRHPSPWLLGSVNMSFVDQPRVKKAAAGWISS